MYQERLKIDWLTVGLWLFIMLFGWMNIYAATYDGGETSLFDFSTYHCKQLVWMAAASLMAILILFSEPRFFSNAAYPIYALVLVLLVVTLFIATVTKGGKSWIDLGPFKLQPSEFAKFATALALSKYMSAIDVEWKNMRTKLAAAIIVLIPMGLVFLQHDTGSALVFLGFVLPLFREGLSGVILVVGLVAVALFVLALLVNKYILLGALVLIALFYLFVWLSKRTAKDYWRTVAVLACCAVFIFSVDFVFTKVLEPHQRERIEVLLGMKEDLRGVGYNVHQSLIAIGSGGLLGKGYLQGTQTTFGFVPEQSTDFIFCTVGEEWGFVGSLLLIVMYGLLIFWIIQDSERARNASTRIYGYCVASCFFMHLAINIGMTLGLMPVIGIPLPLFSYGGSSLWAFTLLLFIFIALERQEKKYF